MKGVLLCRKYWPSKREDKEFLTSAQIADCYGTTVDCIKQNFYANKTRFVEGKHYIALVGSELRDFKNKVRIPYSVENKTENEVRNSHSAEVKAKHQFDTQFKYAKSLYLWTEKGALLHAKSLNTDKAWEVYDYLVDFYFRAKEKIVEPEKKEIVPAEVREDTQNSKIPPKDIDKKSLDIAPMFRQVLTMLPTDALDEMERSFRSSKAQAVKLAAVSILAEKMKRELAE